MANGIAGTPLVVDLFGNDNLGQPPATLITAGAAGASIQIADGSGEMTISVANPGVYNGTYTIENAAGTSTGNFTVTFEAPPPPLRAPDAVDDLGRVSGDVPFSINLLDNDDLGNPTAVFQLTSELNYPDCALTSSGESGLIAGTCRAGGTVDGAYTLTNSEGSDTAQVSFYAPQ